MLFDSTRVALPTGSAENEDNRFGVDGETVPYMTSAYFTRDRTLSVTQR